MDGINLWWLGQSGFQLRALDGGPVVFIDPYLTADDERSWPAPADPAALAMADVVLCTHEHVDHFDRPTLKAAAAIPGSKFMLVVPEPIVEQAITLGIPEAKVIGAQPGHHLEVNGVSIDPIPACHGVHVADAYSFGEQLSHGLVRYLGYVVELGGIRVYHAGDTIPYQGQIDILRELQPDLAMLPINGRDYYREHDRDLVGTMDPREAAHLAAAIGADALVPMHWDLFHFNRGFPRDLIGYVTEYYPSLTVLIFGRSARIAYLPQRKAE